MSDVISNEATRQTIELAEETMGKDFLSFVVQELKAMQKPWQQMSQMEQDYVLDRARLRVGILIHDAIALLAGNGWVSVLADVESVAIKDHVKATLKISRNNSEESMHELFGSRNQPCRIVLASADDYTGGMDQIKGEADQRVMDLNAAEGDEDPLIDEAIEHVRATQKASIAFVQKKLRIGYNRAARIIEEMEQRGVITAADRNGNRKIIQTETGPTE